MLILGVETSCDDTGAALFDSKQGLLTHLLYSQLATHQPYGGVVPELAARDHLRKCLPLIRQVLVQADITASTIDGVAYTAGPGLAGALLVGAALGRSLAFAWNIPACGVHHMEGHLLAVMLEQEPPPLPFLALLVSGGHTLLVDVQHIGQYRILGQTLDDAAGEAFDKTAKILGLAYPGGPAIATAALDGDSSRFRFPLPMLNRPGLDFSYSGMKTFALTLIAQQQPLDSQTLADIAAGFQRAMVESLALKCRRALLQTGYRHLVVAGGVSANQALRQRLQGIVTEVDARLYCPRPDFCTDNGAMIAYAGATRLALGPPSSLDFTIHPRWSLESLPALS
ncbi:MAG TPA: tRNA (adenosine(37)-N6)-threonylcarbamoyltransferase complex transferase subunit TsaD [Gammaproteobacteria bacterium]|nr:tRNA (adenosine(37)-N6)-threonylcarbamoyltransferase complex transferase subunit TsaD [Gammaproteobacteria bacterium]